MGTLVTEPILYEAGIFGRMYSVSGKVESDQAEVGYLLIRETHLELFYRRRR